MDRTYTTQELVRILEGERAACMGGQRLALEASVSGNPAIDRIVNSNGLQRFQAYQQFRDTIHQYQRDYRVSGLVWREVSVHDRRLRFPTVHDQLLALPSDLVILRDRLPVVVRFWQQAVCEMELYLATNAGRQFVTIAMPDVERLVARSSWAQLHKHERQHERSSFLEILLQVGWGNPTHARDRHGWPDSGRDEIHAVKAGQQPIA